jgi:predicted transcriptional regulator
MTDEHTRHGDGIVADGGTDIYGERGGDSDPQRLDDETGAAMDAGGSRDATQAFLLEVVRRRPLLRALQSGSATTGDVLDAVEMSRSTVHRALNSLTDHGLVEESGGEYRLTSVGKIVARESETFGSRTATARSLDQFLNSINGQAESVPVEHFTDATVVRPTARQPHATIHRIIEFIEEAERLRMFSTVISPVYVDVGYREMNDGMQIDAIFDAEVIDIMLGQYPEKAYETISTGNFDVYAHDGLPFELFIAEDKVGMAAHNDDGNAEILVECRDPAAVGWAERLYNRHLSDAESVSL